VRRQHLVAALALALSLQHPATALARAGDPPTHRAALKPAPSSLWAPAPAPLSPSPRLRAEGHDYTVVGLLIGAGAGFVAGWAFYDLICEAEDNRCSDSRVPKLVLGAGLGAGLGALIGSTLD
jgi:hypothetical protein